MENNKSESLFKIISSAVVDGELPKDFSLPRSTKDENEIVWADGAMDGVGMYHMWVSEMSEENHELMAKAVRTASDRCFDRADELFYELGQKSRALFSIDALQSYIIDHKEELNAGNIYEYGVHALVDSTDRECLKFGLSLLELFDTDRDEKLKDIIRIIGLNDEFSIFAIFVMLHWEDGNNEVWQLARKIHGWGRIHAIERIEPNTEEIKRWLLEEGVHNNVMSAYSALTCWQKSNAQELLKGNLSKEEYRGIRDIIEGLLNGGPVSGISEIENADGIIIAFLNYAKNFALELADYEVIRAIRIYYENENLTNPGVTSLCQEILSTAGCKTAVLEAVKSGRAIGLAQDLNLEYKEEIFTVMEEDFEKKNHLCSFLIGDPEYRDRVITVFRQKLLLSEMKTQPTKSHGLGREYWRQDAIEYLLQGLREYPLEGQDFVETALQSAPIRTRNSGMYILEKWISAKGIPLSELLPKFQELICQLRKIEPDDKVKRRMDRLISGTIIFKDEPEGDEE